MNMRDEIFYIATTSLICLSVLLTFWTVMDLKSAKCKQEIMMMNASTQKDLVHNYVNVFNQTRR